MSPSEDEETTPSKRAVEPKVFTPLPSTSRDTATFDLNDKMYVDIYGNTDEEDSSFSLLKDDEPPKKRPALDLALSLPLPVPLSLPDPPASPSPEPETRIDDDVTLDGCVDVHDVVSVDDTIDTEIVCCEKTDSDEPLILNHNSDVEIVDTRLTRRYKRKRRSRLLADAPVVVLDSSDEDVLPISNSKRTIGRLTARRKSPVRRSPTPSNDSVSAESGIDTTMGAYFDPLLSFIGDMLRYEGKNNLERLCTVVDTVDLSEECNHYKPTPIINEVIVIDSDSPVRVQPASFIPTPAPESSVTVENKLLDCPVCLETFSSSKPSASTFCGHIFCKPCMVSVMNTSRRCPTCRKHLKGKGFHLLYL